MLKVQNNSMGCYNSKVQIQNKHLEGLWAFLWVWNGWQATNQWLLWEDGKRDITITKKQIKKKLKLQVIWEV